MWFGDSACRRGLPHRPIVGLAVVVACQPEGQQERQRDCGVRQPPHVRKKMSEMACLRDAPVTDARRVERCQVVVVRHPVVGPEERPNRRIDDERGEPEVGPQRRPPPCVGPQCALRNFCSGGGKDSGGFTLGRRRAHWVPDWPPTPSSSTSRQKSVAYWVSGTGIFSAVCCRDGCPRSSSEMSMSSRSTSLRSRSASLMIRCIAGLSP